jgi:hypothetical protein
MLDEVEQEVPDTLAEIPADVCRKGVGFVLKAELWVHIYGLRSRSQK